MSCTNPNLMRFVLDRDTGSVNHYFEGSAKRFDPSIFCDMSELQTRGYYTQLVPCGHCPDCRASYAREWSNRCLIELEDMGCAIFVLLTYDNDHLPVGPDGPTLRPKDTQLFLKRLRKAFPDKRIRFFMCGEYGTRTNRPHYHIILFGLSLSDFPDAVCQYYNKLKQPVFRSDTLNSIWKLGFTSIGSVTKSSCDYVARYTLKKQMDIDSDGKYPLGIVPPFNRSSLKPGIGMLRRDEFVLAPDMQITVDGKDGNSYSFGVPKAFFKSAKNSGFALDILARRCYDVSVAGQARLEQLLDAYKRPYPEILDLLADKKKRSLKLLPERSDL